jgi:hypothetical protein
MFSNQNIKLVLTLHSRSRTVRSSVHCELDYAQQSSAHTSPLRGSYTQGDGPVAVFGALGGVLRANPVLTPWFR